MARFIIIQIVYQQVNKDYEYAEEKKPDLLALVTSIVNKYIIWGS